MESNSISPASKPRFGKLWIFVSLLFLNACASSSSRQVTYSRYESPITFTVSCSDPATHYAGTITTDGKTETVEGTGTRTYVAEGHKIHVEFEKREPSGTLTLAAKYSSGAEATTSTSRPRGKVEAKFLRSRSQQYRMMSSY